ncbi:MAG TPA: Ig-like domain-containing protein [Ramlibacter sp.]|uniref:Ig-like domain-containing protein n=1 Tax=Ramlibacter sp. TaxID=1917967 RepID=UPI002B8F7B64|nr:Ig-like domain-containing protein [Ramlibacter sp.]HVZ43668.1 Ig-like domain-containing protein [Ramlibacter sp.]
MTTFLVNITGDASGSSAGTGSGTSGDLRYCLYQASLDGVVDTITFDSSVFAGASTITLSAILSTVPGGYVNPYGQTAFVIGADDVTIDGSLGAGMRGITIDGVGATRLFAVEGGGSLSLINTTLTGGYALGGAGGNGGVGGGGGGGAGLGGAVLVDGSTSSFTANGVTFVNNQAQGGKGGSTDAGSSQAGGGGGGMGAAGSAASGTTGGHGGGVNGANGGPILNAGGLGGLGGGAGGGGGGANGTSIGRPGGAGGLGGGGGGGGNFSHGGFGGFGGGGGGGGGGRGTSLGGAGGFGAGNGGRGAFNNKGGGGGGGAGLGGAIFSNGGTITLVNSTFTQNGATGGIGGTGSGSAAGDGGAGSGRGGAVFVRNGTLNATFVTMSGNTAAQGGTDLFVLSDGSGQRATVTLKNSILGQNAATSVTDFFATTNGGGQAADLSASSNNLVTLNASGSNGLAPGALVAGTNPNFDPAGLADNGGPTPTIALTTASTAALQAGAAGTGITVDQRGLGRGAPPDLGAYSLALLITSITSSDVSLIASDPNPTITFVLNTPAAAGTFKGGDVSVKDGAGNTVGAVGALSTTDNLTFTGTLTPNAGFNGDALISVAANRVTSTSGIGNQVSPTLHVTVDKVAPAVTSITSTDLTLLAGDANPAITFTLSEPAAPDTFTASDVSVTDSTGNIVGTIGKLGTTDSQTFTGIFTPNAGFTGTALISVAANRFTDVPGNSNDTASSTLRIVVDKVAPTVTSITTTDNSLIIGDADPIITFTLSEAAAADSFTGADVSVQDGSGAVVGTIGALSTKDNITFTSTFTPNAGYTGTAFVSVGANRFTDVPGNGNAASSALAIAVDEVAPTIASIASSDTALAIGDADPTITFTLSEAAAADSFTAADVSVLDGSGAVVGTIGALSTKDNIAFTSTFTPNAGFTGTAFVSVGANRFTDAPGNGNAASAALGIDVDKVAPTVNSIASSDVALANGDADPTITFTLSEPAAAGSFTAADVSVVDGTGAVVGTLNAWSTSDSQTFTGTFTPNPGFNGTAWMSIAAARFTDVIGNANTASSTLVIEVDTVAPTVTSIASTNLSVTNADADPAITFTLSEAPAPGTFTAGDVSVLDGTGAVVGTMGALATSDNRTFTGTFTPNAAYLGTALISIAANEFTDAVGNGNAASSVLSIAVDRRSPVITAITSTDVALKNGDANPKVSFTVSEAVKAGTFTAADITIQDSTGAVVGTMGGLTTADNKTFSGTFTPKTGFNGTALISVAADQFTNAAGKGNLASPQLAIVVDKVAPKVTSITSSDLSLVVGDADPTITFTLSEPAAAGTFTAADVSVKNSAGAVVGTMGALTTSDDITFSGTFTPNSAFTGTALIGVAANQFTDVVGNNNTASTNLSVAVDRTAPTVTVTASDHALKAGETSTLTIVLSETGTGFTLGDLSVTPGSGTLGNFSQTSGSPPTYTVRFTPAPGYEGDATITVADGAFSDAAGNPSLPSNSTVIAVDTKPPVAPSLSLAAASDAGLPGDNLTNVKLPTIAGVAEAGAKVQLRDGTTVIGSTTALADGSYSIVPTSARGDGVHQLTVMQTDLAGNASPWSAPLAVTVDTKVPTVTTISSSDPLLASGETATLTFKLSEAAASGTFDASDISVTHGSLSGFAQSATSDLVYTALFTPDPGQTTPAAVGIAAGSFTDAAGNANTASSTLGIAMDTAVPTVTAITSTDVDLIDWDAAPTITFTLSEAATAGSFTAADVSVLDGTGTVVGTLGALSTRDNRIFTGTFTPNVGFVGTALISVAANRFTDAVGNGNAASPVLGIAVDLRPPIIAAITSTDVALKNGDANPKITFTLGGAAKAGTFTASDISVTDSTGAVVGTMSGWTTTDNKTFTGTFTPKSGFNGTALISVAADRFTDAAGRGNLASPQLAIVVDKVAPKVTSIISSDLSLVVGDADPTITFTLSEPAAAGTFTAGDVSVKNSAGKVVGTMGELTTSDDVTFSGTFTPDPAFTGTALISVAANQFTDDVGNNNAASTGLSIAVDRTNPTVKVTANDYALKAGEYSTLTIVLSEYPGSGTSFALGDLILVPPGSGTLSNFSQATVRYFFGLFERVVELTYTVRFTPAPGYEGNATITVADGAFSDAAGNPSLSSDSTVIAVDTKPPVAPSLSLAAASDSGLPGDNITNVKLPTITGVAEAGAKVQLRDGATVIGSTTALADGSYSIVPTSARGDGVHQLSVMQTDLAGNASPWSAPLPVTVDTKVPTVTITSNDLLLTSGQSATLTFKLSEAAAANSFDASDISVAHGSLSGFAQSASSNLVYTALFTPDPGLVNTAAPIGIAAGSFTDAAGNANSSASLSSVKINNATAQLIQALASFAPPASAIATPVPQTPVHAPQLAMPH